MRKKEFIMKSNDPKNRFFKAFLIKIPLRKLSKESNFCKRKPKKIYPQNLIVGFFLMVSNSGTHSFQHWASKIGLLTGKTISKQALWKRMNQDMILFLQKVLSSSLANSMEKSTISRISKRLKVFKNIFLEDSTHIQVDGRLAKFYPGNKYAGARGGESEKAIVKLHVIYNLTKTRFEQFMISNFRKSDCRSAEDILEIARAGDLILRDLGFCVLAVYKIFISRGIYFISRLKGGTNIYLTKEAENPINLAKMLRKRGQLDLTAFTWAEERVQVKIIALPVEESVASERRRKLKQDRNKRYRPNKEKLFILGWEIFITNVENDKLEARDIASIYFLRWRIEILFKCWKSHMKIDQVPHSGNRQQLEAYIYCMLIYIVIIQVGLYHYHLSYEIHILKHAEVSDISIMKFTQLVFENGVELILSEFKRFVFTPGAFEKQILYHSRYEIRNDRKNFIQKSNF